MTFRQMSVVQMPVGQISVGQMPVGEMSFGQTFFEPKMLNQFKDGSFKALAGFKLKCCLQ